MTGSNIPFIVIFSVLTLGILYGILQRKIWIWYVAFPLLFLAAFHRMSWAREEVLIDVDRIYHLEGTIKKVVESSNHQQLLYMDSKEFHGIILYLNENVNESDIASDSDNVREKKNMDSLLIKGDYISCDTKMSYYPVARNPGNFDQRKYYSTMNIEARGYPTSVQIIRKNQNPWMKGIFLLKRRLMEVYERIGLDEDAGIYTSILLGDKSLLDSDVKKMYQDNGMAHILAISGLHISILGMGLYRLLRKGCLPFVPCFIICFVLMISYGIMTGNSVSTIRAVAMFLVSVMADVAGRRYDMPSAMALAAIMILLIYPKMLFNSSFQLSFLAVLGIMLIKPALEIALKEKIYRKKSPQKVKKRPILDSILTSLSVNIATLPVLLCSFFVFPPYSIFLNVIVLPLMSIVMFCAVAAGFLGLWSIPIAVFISGAAHYILQFYKWLCGIFQKLPGSLLVLGKPYMIGIVIYYLLIIGAILLAYHIGKYIMNLFIVGFLVISYHHQPPMMVRMLDVGQGDCIHIQSLGKSMLIDAGSTSVKQVGEYRLLDYLKSQGENQLDYVVMTHADQDHVSAILELMEEGSERIRCLVLPKIYPITENYGRVVDLARSKQILIHYIRQGEVFYMGKLRVDCLHPEEGYPYASENDYSCVLQVSYKDYKMLFTGDLEDLGENHLLSEKALQDVEVLKVAHHGSKYSTDEEFLSVVRPEIALISAGEKNSYGHPHKELLERLETYQSAIYCTKETGAITVKERKKELVVETFLK